VYCFAVAVTDVALYEIAVVYALVIFPSESLIAFLYSEVKFEAVAVIVPSKMVFVLSVYVLLSVIAAVILPGIILNKVSVILASFPSASLTVESADIANLP
jgi:hypothetical protein